MDNMHKFIDTFSQYISPENIIILAVSGGVDSMVLLDLVRKCHPGENIVVAHFDHSLRGAESDGDMDFITNFCKKINITIQAKKMDIGALAKEKKWSLEAIARHERYMFLEEVRKKYHAKYILTAHHADDQVETIFLNLLKWWKIQGLSGMSILSGYILRPFLTKTKSEILHYAETCHIEYREDSTNADTNFERNKIRHQVTPVFQEINPSFHRTIEHLAEYMQDMTSYFDAASREWFANAEKNSGKPRTFLITEFLGVHPFFQRELIVELYRHAHHGSSQWLSSKLVEELIRFIADKNSFWVKDIGRMHLERRGERIFIG